MGNGFRGNSWSVRSNTDGLRSWTWCVVLILAAYTANLASFLVVQAKAQPSFTSLDGAVRRNKKICVSKGSADEDWFQARYARYDNLMAVQSGPAERAALLRDGTCDVATFAKFEYDFLRQTASVNPSCYMQTIGDPFQNMDAGWMVLNDVQDSCTSLVRDVLGFWFLRMELDGTLEALVRRALMPVENCPVESTSGDSEASAGQLTIESMLGIFTVHAVGVGTALLFHLFSGAPKALTKGLTRTFTSSRVSPQDHMVHKKDQAGGEAWGEGELQ